MDQQTKIKVVWREYYNENAVEKLTAMGTLPRYETEIPDSNYLDGEEIAAVVAQESNRNDNESFQSGGDMVILEPAEFAGTYTIDVQWEPYFSATKED
jgi:hypothetical protein